MSQANNVIAFDATDYTPNVAEVGGKGASLIKMYQAGIPVPNGFVITTNAYHEYSQQDLPEDFQQQVLAAFDALSTERVAVRSSAVSEDSDTASWAGQFESFMNVTKDALLVAVKNCWASVRDALSYAETQDTSGQNLAVAVVVQKMVDSEVAGVAFSVNPINHDQNQIMIEATYGLGELLVQGMVNPDNYVIAKSDGTIVEKHISTKTNMLTYKDGTNQEVAVDLEKQNEPCLNDGQLTSLQQMACRIEDYYASPQDIEFAFSNGELNIVQSRPITTI